uniref:Complex 1 LYR protein domain-containing protein n=1 Tax=Globisporangium ultimum (strain ATCC 200006 / CBS 805.95 / DAOM BR144) TaxID=431595 RepID=K3X5D9_GLOUD
MVAVVNSAAKTLKPKGATHSGLQMQVLALYKKALRTAQQKDRELVAASSGATAEVSTLTYVRERFRDDARSVGRMDFNVIEHLIRKGERDIKMMERMKGAKFTHVPRPKA